MRCCTASPICPPVRASTCKAAGLAGSRTYSPPATTRTCALRSATAWPRAPRSSASTCRTPTRRRSWCRCSRRSDAKARKSSSSSRWATSMGIRWYSARSRHCRTARASTRAPASSSGHRATSRPATTHSRSRPATPAVPHHRVPSAWRSPMSTAHRCLRSRTTWRCSGARSSSRCSARMRTRTPC